MSNAIQEDIIDVDLTLRDQRLFCRRRTQISGAWSTAYVTSIVPRAQFLSVLYQNRVIMTASLSFFSSYPIIHSSFRSDTRCSTDWVRD